MNSAYSDYSEFNEVWHNNLNFININKDAQKDFQFLKY